MDAKLKKSIYKHFPEKEAQEIEKFINRGFAPRGERILVGLFLEAKENKVKTETVLRAMREQWQAVWIHQHPEIRASLWIEGQIGEKNQDALLKIRIKLGIPLMSQSMKIPTEAIIVETINSAYEFGAADQTGKRTVARSPDELDFGYCRIHHLRIGDSMVLECLDGTRAGGSWVTTIVVSVEESA